MSKRIENKFGQLHMAPKRRRRGGWKARLTGASGSLDLASIMIGVLTLAVIGGVISATVFAVIPWSQDSAARSSIDSVRVAEGVARALDNQYLDGPGLVDRDLLPNAPGIRIGTDPEGSCFVAVATSDSGNQFFGTSKGPEVDQLTDSTPSSATGWCLDIDALLGDAEPDAGPVVPEALEAEILFDGGGTVYADFGRIAVTPSGDLYAVIGNVFSGMPMTAGSPGIYRVTAAGNLTAFNPWPGESAPTMDASVTVSPSGDLGIFKTSTPEFGYWVDQAGATVAGYPAWVPGRPGEFAPATFSDVAAVNSGDVFYADSGNNLVGQFTHSLEDESLILTADGTPGFVDGIGTAARFNSPCALAVTQSGKLIVADAGNHAIRMIDPVTGVVTTLAGTGSAGYVDGAGSTAQFKNPTDVEVAPNGVIYVVDKGNGKIRTIDPITGVVGTLDLTGAAISGPKAIAVDGAGVIYISNGSRIFRLS